jgi:TonB family protein
MENYISITGEGGRIAIEVLAYENPSAANQDDANWLATKLAVEAGPFSGSFKVAFTTHDLISLHDQHRIRQARKSYCFRRGPSARFTASGARFSVRDRSVDPESHGSGTRGRTTPVPCKGFLRASSMARRHIYALALAVLISMGFSQGQTTSFQQADKGTVTVQPNNAEKNLIKKITAVYPPLAKQVRLQGTVKLQVVISTTGTIESVKVLSGPPLLAQAAVDAVKQWQYKPFSVDGRPVAASTEIDVPFTLGISDAVYQTEQKNNEDYFKREDECRSLLKAHQYADAETSCTSSVELVNKLPDDRQMERLTANDLAGQSLLYTRKYDEALSFFQREVIIGEKNLKPTDAELGYAYHHAALGYEATGDVQKAQFYYERAESTLETARQHMDSDFFKSEYAKALQSVLRDYIVFLQQTGQTDAAAKAQQQADTLAHENHP